MTTTVALFLLTLSFRDILLVNGVTRTEIFSYVEPLYLPDDPNGPGPYQNVPYTPDIEIMFNITLHSLGLRGQNIFRLGQPDLAQYEYPFILFFGYDSWVERDVTRILRAVWDKPGYDGLNGNDIPYITIDSPYKMDFGLEYKFYYRLTPSWMYIEINNNETQYGYSLNKTIDSPYNTSCCLDNIWSIYLGADNIRPAANATISNLYVYSIEPTPGPTSDPTNDPTSDPTSDPTMETDTPSADPTSVPTMETDAPTKDPTSDPTYDPTIDPTSNPTADPTNDPTANPSSDPTSAPTQDTESPTTDPSIDPTIEPTDTPSTEPTIEPTSDQAVEPTNDESMEPSSNPTPDVSSHANSKYVELFAVLCAVCLFMFC